MKLDFNFDFIGLDDQVFEGGNAGKMLAGALASASKGDALKFWDWAKKLFKGEILDLDKSDQETLKTFVKDSESFTVLAKAQLLEAFIKD
jgi:hypothetical protein